MSARSRLVAAGVVAATVTGLIANPASQAALPRDPENPQSGHSHIEAQDVTVAAADPALSHAGWTATADSAQGVYPASNAIDGNTSTFWHTQYSPTVVPLPHTFTIDMHNANIVSGLRYTPRTDSANGRVGAYRITVSSDGTTWGNPVASGTFSDDQGQKTVPFVATTARFVRITVLSEAGNRGQWTSAR